jgi:uncharacterized membrane protein
MRRRWFHLFAVFITVGCSGGPDQAAPRELPADRPVVEIDTSDAAAVPPDTAVQPVDTARVQPAAPPPADTADTADPWHEARARGVDFRAIGQEPGWFLEIDDDAAILFAYDYGTERTSMPAPEPYRDESTGRITYRATSGPDELVIIIEAEPCFDTMSGEAFDRTVTVSLGAREYRGCGRVL